MPVFAQTPAESSQLQAPAPEQAATQPAASAAQTPLQAPAEGAQTNPQTLPQASQPQNQAPAQSSLQQNPVSSQPVQASRAPQNENNSVQMRHLAADPAKRQQFRQRSPQVSAVGTTPASEVSTAPAEASLQSPAAPASLDSSTSPASPPDQGSLYRSRWAQDSVQVLQENGIQLPQGINYSALISQGDYIRLLAQISSAPEAKLNQYKLQPESNSGITRGEAIHLVLASFGLVEALPGFAKQSSRFKDLPQDHLAYASVVLAESLHLINGYPDQTIRPDERLSWGEALILVETVYSWRKALPTTAPEWVKNYQQRQNMWYQLIDGFRLLLTLAYVGLAIYFFVKIWLKLKNQKHSPYRKFTLGLGIVTLLLGALWISELLFNYSLIPREIYASLAMLSVFAGLLLMKIGSDIDGDLSKPKPQVVIDAGYVTSINHEKGELFIKDRATNAHSLALAGADTKILRKTGVKSVESAFLSDVQVGDLISLRASQLEHQSLLEIERLTLVEQAQQQVSENQQQGVREYVQTPQQQQQQQLNRIVPQRPRSA